MVGTSSFLWHYGKDIPLCVDLSFPATLIRLSVTQEKSAGHLKTRHITAEIFLDFLDPQAMPLAQVGHMGPK